MGSPDKGGLTVNAMMDKRKFFYFTIAIHTGRIEGVVTG